jgi:hypothetical protein
MLSRKLLTEKFCNQMLLARKLRFRILWLSRERTMGNWPIWILVGLTVYYTVMGLLANPAVVFFLQATFACLLLAAGIVLWRKYGERIMSSYYFAFYPHPAEPLVRNAIISGAPLDGPSLSSALAEIPHGNRVLSKVRLVQAERLFAEMQAVSAERVEELQRKAKTEQERAAAISAQEAIALAASALERSNAALRASRAVHGG